MDDGNFTYIPHGSQWLPILRAFEIISIATLSITVWILICVIIYGCKSRKWTRRKSSSSLSSGLIYWVLTTAIGFFVVRLSLTEVTYVLPRIDGGLDFCDIFYDILNAAYIFTLYGAYMFLWFLQRLIYLHPYVRQKIGRIWNIMSKLFGGWFTLSAFGILFAFIYENPVTFIESGCVLLGNDSFVIKQGVTRNIISASVLVASQLIIICLCVYPAIKVKFETKGDEVDSVRTNGKRNPVKEFITASIKSEQTKFASPIELTVKRTMVSAIIMVTTDTLALLLSFVAFPSTAPLALRQTIYDVSSLIDVLCMLATLGCTIKVLTLCCPSRKMTIRNGRPRTRNIHAVRGTLGV